jgi:hypothetical protein
MDAEPPTAVRAPRAAVPVPLRLSATQEIQHFRSHRSQVTDHLIFEANIA